jgi:hypothetical protein
MSETRWVEVEAAKALIEKMIDCVAETQGRFSADLMIELEAQLDSLAELDALSQISSKNYGADDIGLTHEEVDSFLAVQREPVETDAIEYIFDNFPIDEDVDKAREQLEALKAELASMTAKLKEADAIIKRVSGIQSYSPAILEAREYLAKVGK